MSRRGKRSWVVVSGEDPQCEILAKFVPLASDNKRHRLPRFEGCFEKLLVLADPDPEATVTPATLFGEVRVKLPRLSCTGGGCGETGGGWPSHCRSTPELEM
jgi:hypothetical protein